ncbi:hypothetical protein SEA_FRANCOB_129 [Streptomyces phage Francob]
MANQVKVGSLVLILAGEGEGDTATVTRIDVSGNIQAKMNRGPKSGQKVLSRKGNYKVIS